MLFFLFVLLLRRYIGYEILKISYHFISLCELPIFIRVNTLNGTLVKCIKILPFVTEEADTKNQDKNHCKYWNKDFKRNC